MVEQSRVLETEPKGRIRYVGFEIVLPILPEAKEALKRLKQRGYQLFLVSSASSQTAINETVKEHDLQELIKVCLGTDPQNPDFKNGKPDFEVVAKYFRIPYEEFVKQAAWVGVVESEIRLAVENKLIALAWSESLESENAQKLQAAGARFVLGDLWSLPQILPSL